MVIVVYICPDGDILFNADLAVQLRRIMNKERVFELNKRANMSHVQIPYVKLKLTRINYAGDSPTVYVGPSGPGSLAVFNMAASRGR